MKLVVDTSVVIALLASDEDQNALVERIGAYAFVCAESLYPEVGNALSAMFKRNRITLSQAIAMLNSLYMLDIQIMPLNLERALEISHQHHIYAYDAYVLECAERLNVAIVTLDARVKAIARQLGIAVVEV